MWWFKRVVAFLAVVAFGYLGWYYVLVSNDGFGRPKYEIGGTFAQVVFEPWHEIDRWLCPDEFFNIENCGILCGPLPDAVPDRGGDAE